MEATRADAHEEQDKEKEGLKEGQIPTTPTLEAIPPESKEKDQEKVPSESGFSLTCTRLKIHQETQDAIKGLKEGHLSEEDFWKKSIIVTDSLSGRNSKMKETKTNMPKVNGQHCKGKV